MKLIDCSNTKKVPAPLSLMQRAKNLAVPLRYAEDVNHYHDAGLRTLSRPILRSENSVPTSRNKSALWSTNDSHLAE